MYKIGDKVEYLNNVWEVCDWEIDSVEIYNEKMGVNIYVPIDDVKPYRTAHEKLIEMGYELIDREEWIIYKHKNLPRIVIHNGNYSCSDTNLALSRILTAYLEELE